MIEPIPIPARTVDLSTRPPRTAAKLPRAILRVRWGPSAFKKFILEPGAVFSVGRNEDCDVCLAHDRELAGFHFELDWDGSRSELRDRHSRSGTLVGGRPVISEWLSNGGWIRAGATDFAFHIEGASRPLPHPPGADPALKHAALRALAGERARDDVSLWAIVDAARNERILTLLEEAVEEHRSLYEGLQGAALERVAPYSVRFSADSELLERLVFEGWGDAWAVFFTSRETPKEVRRHLRRFLVVEEEDTKKRLYFRFYDPRVLRDFLGIATPRQTSELFHGIERTIFEDAAGGLAFAESVPPPQGEVEG